MNGFAYWLSTRAVKPYSPETVRAYIIGANQWLQWCNDEDVDFQAATQANIKAYLADIIADGRSPATARIRLAALRVFYRYLKDEGVVSENVAETLPLGQAMSRSGEPYTANEIRRMFLACRTHQERAVFMLLVGTGLRRGEVHRINREDCNMDAGTVRILGKGGQYRYVMPEPSVLQALDQALAFNDRLCPQSEDDVVWMIIKRLAARAGIAGRHHPHRLRFTFAVEWCESGLPESELMEVLGHRSLKMTMYYSKVGRQRRALRSMRDSGIAGRLLGEPVEPIEAAG